MNKSKFQNRIAGLVSYFGNKYLDENTVDFPTLLPVNEIKIPMSREQYSYYQDAREREMKEMTFGKASAGKFKSSGDTVSSYKIKSRLLCNALIPEYAKHIEIMEQSNKERVVKDVSKIKEEDLSEKKLLQYSPKNVEILHILKKYPNSKGFIACEFRESEGIMFTARVLEANGYELFKLQPVTTSTSTTTNKDEIAAYVDEDEDIIGGSSKNPKSQKSNSKSKSPKSSKSNSKSKSPKSPKSKSKSKKFIIISGNISQEDRIRLVDEYNSSKNVNGSVIQLALLTKAGAMGIELKESRFVIHLGPYWNMMLYDQITFRGRRYKSHIALPLKDRNIQPYMLLSTKPEFSSEAEKKSIMSNVEDEETETTDEYLYERAILGKILIDEFIIAMIESSIDCLYNLQRSKSKKINVNCKKCSPTNIQLYKYPNNVEDDILLSDPCIEAKVVNIKVKKIIEPESKNVYHYDENTKEIYTFSKDVNGYKKLERSHPDYYKVLELIY
jgi:hypothetical protein